MVATKNNDVILGVLAVPWEPKLKELLIWIENKWSNNTITCAYEKRDYSSVHSTIPLRGFDLRSRNFIDPQKIADEINSQWIYDPQRPEKKCCVFHDVGKGPHFHLQVHNDTFCIPF